MIEMKIYIGKDGLVKTDFNKNVEVTGYEGVLSRVQAPTYRVFGDHGGAICEIKRHIFSNLPFFTIDFLDDKPPVKLSQEMSEFQICYSVHGRGMSFSGDFTRGDIEIIQEQGSLGRLKADVIGDDLVINIQANSSDDIFMIGIGLAYGLMLAYLRRPLYAGDKS